jgi:hypothetical protein
MSTTFEDWLKEKRPAISALHRAKLVQEFTEFMEHAGVKNFDKMSPQQAREVFAVLIAEEERRLASLRELLAMLADGDEDYVQ